MTDADTPAPDRETVTALLAELDGDYSRPSEITDRETARRYFAALALSVDLRPEDVVLYERPDGSYRPELRETVLRDRETLAAADHLLTSALLEEGSRRAEEIAEMSVTEKLAAVRGGGD